MAASAKNGASGFEACGLYPYDPAKIPDHAFAPSEAHNAEKVPSVNSHGTVNAAQVTDTALEEPANREELVTATVQPDVSNSPNSTPSTSTTSVVSLQVAAAPVSFADIYPIPADGRSNKRQRKTANLGGQLLTSPEHVNLLREKANRKGQKRQLSQPTKSGKSNKKTTGKNSSLRLGKNSSKCAECKERNAPDGSEEWVQCLECLKWFHECCVFDEMYFVCRFCHDDDSD